MGSFRLEYFPKFCNPSLAVTERLPGNRCKPQEVSALNLPMKLHHLTLLFLYSKWNEMFFVSTSCWSISTSNLNQFKVVLSPTVVFHACRQIVSSSGCAGVSSQRCVGKQVRPFEENQSSLLFVALLAFYQSFSSGMLFWTVFTLLLMTHYCEDWL